MLIRVLAASSPIANRLEEANPTAGCVQGFLCVQKHMGFPYGLAKSRTENSQVMGQVGNARGSCRWGPLLSDELQKS